MGTARQRGGGSAGLDKAEVGVEAYPEFAGSGRM